MKVFENTTVFLDHSELLYLHLPGSWFHRSYLKNISSVSLNRWTRFSIQWINSCFPQIFNEIVNSLWINPRPDVVWKVTRHDGEGGQRPPPVRSPKLRFGSEKFKRHWKELFKMHQIQSRWIYFLYLWHHKVKHFFRRRLFDQFGQERRLFG